MKVARKRTGASADDVGPWHVVALCTTHNHLVAADPRQAAAAPKLSEKEEERPKVARSKASSSTSAATMSSKSPISIPAPGSRAAQAEIPDASPGPSTARQPCGCRGTDESATSCWSCGTDTPLAFAVRSIAKNRMQSLMRNSNAPGPFAFGAYSTPDAIARMTEAARNLQHNTPVSDEVLPVHPRLGEQLPDEIWVKIMGHLDVPTRFLMTKVSWRMRAIVQDVTTDYEKFMFNIRQYTIGCDSYFSMMERCLLTEVDILTHPLHVQQLLLLGGYDYSVQHQICALKYGTWASFTQLRDARKSN